MHPGQCIGCAPAAKYVLQAAAAVARLAASRVTPSVQVAVSAGGVRPRCAPAGGSIERKLCCQRDLHAEQHPPSPPFTRANTGNGLVFAEIDGGTGAMQGQAERP